MSAGGWVVGRILLAVAVLWLGVPAFAGDPTPSPASAGTSGMRAYIDPETGEFTSEGPPLALPSPESLPLGTGAEEDSPVDGKMIRLRGRFLSALVVRLQPDGSERLECVTLDGAPPPVAP